MGELGRGEVTTIRIPIDAKLPSSAEIYLPVEESRIGGLAMAGIF